MRTFGPKYGPVFVGRSGIAANGTLPHGERRMAAFNLGQLP